MKPTVALSMIVRNGGDDLAHCLESVRGIVDEIVIADTGSTDATLETAATFSAKTIRIPWQNDFAAARNASLRETHSDWVLSLDADEQLDEQAGRQIRKAIANPETMGYLVPIRNYVQSMQERIWDKPAIKNDERLPRAAQFPAYLEHENVRLFRRHPEIYFEGRVHETVGHCIEHIGGKLEHSDFVIHHFGFASSPEQKAAKNLFYRKLGRQKIQEMPQSAQAHFELGLVEFDNFHNHAEALALFTRACELNDKLAVSWFFRGVVLSRLQRHREALPCFEKAAQLGGGSAACREAQGDALYQCKQFAEARQAYRRSLKAAPNQDVLSKLGLTELRLGRVDAALEKLRSAACGSEPEVYDRLITGLVYSSRVAEAAEAAEDKIRQTGASEAAYKRAAALWAHGGQPERARELITAGLREFPASPELANILNELGEDIQNREFTGLAGNLVKAPRQGADRNAEQIATDTGISGK